MLYYLNFGKGKIYIGKYITCFNLLQPLGNYWQYSGLVNSKWFTVDG